MRIYNTLSREKEEFVPLEPKKVKMFVCGPTVYDYPHMGHGRVYVIFDTFAKYLKYKGYQVFYLQNITDIDDKIINRAKERNEDWEQLARKYEHIYYQDMENLGVNSVSLYARATYHIEEIVKQVKKLVELGYGYETSDGYYYNIDKFPEYGKLGHINPEELKAGARVEINEEKINPRDFVLWKKYKEGEPFWETKLGKGRPGWHIEDTAITEKYLGYQYDIHGGGKDLIFPHHDSEIAQMEAISKKDLVKYWMHAGFLMINGEKMSKSLGNYITIREAGEKWGWLTLRLYLLSSNYRTAMDFQFDEIERFKQVAGNINLTFEMLKEETSGNESGNEFEKYVKRFVEYMDDDFSNGRALQEYLAFGRALREAIDTNKLTNDAKERWGNKFVELSKVLGVWQDYTQAWDALKQIVEWRAELRKNKQYELADKIREKLEQSGVKLDDKGGKTRIYVEN